MKPKNILIKASTDIEPDALVRCIECGKIVKHNNVVWVPHSETVDRGKIPDKLSYEIDRKAIAPPVLNFLVLTRFIPLCSECNEIVWDE